MTLMRNEVVELHYPREHFSRWEAWNRTSTGRPIIVEHEGWLFRATDWRKDHDEHDWNYYALHLELHACSIDGRFAGPPATVGPYEWKTWIDHEGREHEGLELNHFKADPRLNDILDNPPADAAAILEATVARDIEESRRRGEF